MKLFTIGDSLSQGFMSGAAAQMTDCYSTLIAKAMGLTIHSTEYRFPEWPHGGLPVNLEAILRRLSRVYGPDIRGAEWLGVPFTVNNVLDRAEDYYERGDGSEDSPYRASPKFGGYEPEFFHNVSSFGFEIADSWLVNGKLCLDEIADAEDVWFNDDFLGPPNAAFYRSALRMLNPSLSVHHKRRSQLDWLEEHAKVTQDQGGIENLILWLGSNNALGTALHLHLHETPNNPKQRPHDMSHSERKERNWTLWHPEDFGFEYQELIRRIVDISCRYGSPKRIFVGNIPHVTIVPLIKGLGESKADSNGRHYYPAYTYFPFEEKFARRSGRFITGSEAQKIDRYIDRYNEFIDAAISEANILMENKSVETRFYPVNINSMLAKAAYKRNKGKPTYKFPRPIRKLQTSFAKSGKLLSTHYYDVDRSGKFTRGGFFSLDGVHPSVIGQGLIAHEFLKEMQKKGVTDNNGNPVTSKNLSWKSICERDKLIAKPIDIMKEIYEHEDVISFISQVLNVLGNVQPRRLDI